MFQLEHHVYPITFPAPRRSLAYSTEYEVSSARGEAGLAPFLFRVPNQPLHAQPAPIVHVLSFEIQVSPHAFPVLHTLQHPDSKSQLELPPVAIASRNVIRRTRINFITLLVSVPISTH